MANMAMITRDVIEDELRLLNGLRSQYAEKKGSAAERKANATLEALDAQIDTTAEGNPMPALRDFVPDDEQALEPVVRMGYVASFVHALDSWAEQAANEAVTAILKAQGDDTTLDAIKAQFDEKRTYVEALFVVARTPAFDVDLHVHTEACQAERAELKGKALADHIAADSCPELELPTLRAARSTSRPTTKRSGKFASYYRIVDGERKYQPASQDTFSSFAWYHGQKILGNGGKIGSVKAAELEAFLKDQGVDSPMGKPWDVVGADGNSYGMDVTTPDTPDEEE